MKTVALLLIVFVPGISAGQTLSPESAAEAPHLVRAAGMPLNDGTLAPGMLTVRVVEGAFTRNLAGQVVEVEVSGGKVESATTGADGRAQFAHLPIGSRVRASTTVAGERLESDFFEVPAQSGVRVLLVAGSGAGSPPPPSEPAARTGASTVNEAAVSAAVPPPAPPTQSANAEGVAVIRAVLATATICALGFVLVSRRLKR